MGSQDQGFWEVLLPIGMTYQPIAFITFHIDHADSARQRSEIDHHVEVEKDAGDSDLRVQDRPFTGLGRNHVRPRLFDLFCEKRRDIRFEPAGAESHDDQANGKAAKRSARIVHD